jgi:hypothetical protein
MMPARKWAARVAALVTALGAGVAFSGHADAVPRTVLGRATASTTTITAVSVSPTAVKVHGLDLTTVVVSVSLKDSERGDPVSVTLSRTTKTAWDPSAPGDLTAPLVRTAGTTGNGTYRAKVAVPSSAHGPWRVGSVNFSELWFTTGVDPRDFGLPDATLKVTGTHRPRMRFTLSPQPLPYPQRALTVSARMSYDDTHRPIPGQPIVFCEPYTDVDCFFGPFVPKARTDSRGLARWHTTLKEPPLAEAAWMPFPLRLALTDPNLYYAAGSQTPLFGSRTTAVPSKTSARHRTSVAVKGHAFAVIPVAENRVVLKRLVGRQWRTVSAARVRSSGRFTLYASPPKGRNSYRVALSGSGKVLGSRSRVFVIKGR